MEWLLRQSKPYQHSVSMQKCRASPKQTDTSNLYFLFHLKKPVTEQNTASVSTCCYSLRGILEEIRESLINSMLKFLCVNASVLCDSG